jgi:ATP-binding protein involved in chromosome partitioning
MSNVTENEILDALRNVIDPDLNKDIVSLGFIHNLNIDNGNVKFDLVLTTPACPVKDVMKKQCEDNILALEGIKKVEIKLDAQTTTSRVQIEALPNVKHILLVGSGKGGVGKSTVAVNLAMALHEKGASVGLMDADIYGPSVPTMVGVHEPPRASEENRLLPPLKFGMPIISIGLMVKASDALVWRGPILHKILTQFVQDVDWGELDYLIIDLPPGTGDVQLSLTQVIKPSAILLVTTPQDIAFADVRRAAMMFHKVNIPVIGVVENMGYFVCPHCDEKTEIFPRTGDTSTRIIDEGFEIETLLGLPLEPQVALTSEQGTPIVGSFPESETAKKFIELAGIVAQKLAVISHRTPAMASTGGESGKD